MENSTPTREVGGDLELSIVMPCLNEAETLERCIAKARKFLTVEGVRGEIVVADNGSTDGSPEIATRLGAFVVNVREKGYGNALRAGISAARAPYIVMGDADDSYDFSALAPFLEKLRQGFDLVMGNRFRGGIEPGAMPWLHRRIGNPILTGIGRVFFRSTPGDFHCGLRAFRKDAFERMNLQSSGMEFASEMVIKATLQSLRVTEVPTVLHKDGRSRPPHLRTWRDGWRHLRFMLLFSPRWLFFIPGIVLMVSGLAIVTILVFGSVRVGSVVFDIHTMFLGGLFCLLGYQLALFAMLTKVFAVTEGFHPAPKYFGWIFRYLNLETGLIAGCTLALVGFGIIAGAALAWLHVSLGDLDPRITMRHLVPGAVLVVLGVQTIYSSFFLSLLGLKRR
jgi:glycosyltransferase involved in cell wall biosynthesis